MKKLTSVLLVIAIILMQVPMAFAASAFSDVKDGDWFADSVEWAVSNDITKGTSATTFSPDAVCTRGQIVTFLWRAAGQPEPTSTDNPFTDVSESDYFYKAVLWAVEKNVTKGATETTFAPDSYCTREQAVAFMHRAEGSPAPLISLNPFTDLASSTWSYNSVLWAVGNGITNGTTGSTFSPGQYCTRAQIVAFLYRMKTVTPPSRFWDVKFDSNGGSAVPTQQIGDGKTVIRPQDPTRAGYKFLGWYTNSNLIALYDFSAPVNGGFTIYAKWEKVYTAYETLVNKVKTQGQYEDGFYDLQLTQSTSGSVVYTSGLEYYPDDNMLVGYAYWFDVKTDKYYQSVMEISDNRLAELEAAYLYDNGNGKAYESYATIKPTSITKKTTSIAFYEYGGPTGSSYKTTHQQNFAVGVRLILDGINSQGLAGTKYSVVDLGFTNYR